MKLEAKRGGTMWRRPRFAGSNHGLSDNGGGGWPDAGREQSFLLGELARLILQAQLAEFATCARIGRDYVRVCSTRG